ncbi:xanthine dehydrogenase family protein molybdopterin-binding subunit [Sandaracinus amylolyticus]|uniref:Periplasmic aromatic aldehyde oxidoreductase, molybdenum binding subunit YagR n=1 Tax=Sandaracinus amylolyticus TaxID=927083 RepID=A0A0F6W0K7_9BACT|nr:xanthine dehydrogenase family protein molybdopterin-binding subunit [Sandaracinus amylolyticus]AKF04380.1 Periplasmic aromatic aldehyde oxidoreductase, molybdenum binding subunit YagR [Sandaracinus amylolyticus]
MIGAPLSRVEGPLKVSGRATYGYEDWSFGPTLYGFVVEATIARGRITSIDTSVAERAPGVRRVLTHRDAPPQGEPDPSASSYARAMPVLKDTEIRAFAQPVALVVARTFEDARAAARLVRITYEITPGEYELDEPGAPEIEQKSVNAGYSADSSIGDLDGALASAPVVLDRVYTTPYAFSLPMETHACIAAWDGDTVIAHCSTQIVADARQRIASTLRLDPEKVRVLSRYVGGGFGSKLGVSVETILAVMAARIVGEPVKVTLTRQQMFHLTGHRPASRQRVRLGASRDGRLHAFGHDAVQKQTRGSDYVEQTATAGRSLYAAPNRRTTHRSIALDLPVAGDVRAPGEAPGLFAIESAMDELAYTLDVDPIALRIANEPTIHPELNIPYSDRRMVECMREGARRFDWNRRARIPASTRDGRWLVGLGMAAAIRPHYQSESHVRVRVEPDGTVRVQCDMTDIGTGTYTVLAQTASEALGVPVDRVRVELGDSALPRTAGSGGSWGATNSCTALLRACRTLREKLGAPSGDVRAHVGASAVDAIGSVPEQTEEPSFSKSSIASYGAHFAEIGVDVDTGEVRLRRMLGVFDVGRVFNAKTARSQLIGGMIWGVSMALHEEGLVDPRVGAFVNRDFAQYLVPVHADIPAVDAIILDGFDGAANELGAKGVGEVGNCGASAAIANAVYSATGVRVRDLPITIEKLLPHLPARS